MMSTYNLIKTQVVNRKNKQIVRIEFERARGIDQEEVLDERKRHGGIYKNI